MNTSLLRSLIFAIIAIVCHSAALSAPPPSVPAYCARVRVKVIPHVDQEAEAFLRAQLPKNDPSISLSNLQKLNLFDICVTSSDPQTAANRANDIAVAIQKALGSDGDIQRLKIWEKAAPPTAPIAQKDAKQ